TTGVDKLAKGERLGRREALGHTHRIPATAPLDINALHIEPELHHVPVRTSICSQWLPCPSAQVDVAFRSQLERGDRADEDRLTRLVHGMFANTHGRRLAGKDRSPATMSEDLDRTMLHASACHGSTSLPPVCTKSLTFRVAQVAPWARQIAAICASAVLIGAPVFSRATSTPA